MIEAGERLLRPILITTLATISGMTPFASRRRRLSNVPAPGHGRHWRHRGFNDPVAAGHSGGSLLSDARVKVAFPTVISVEEIAILFCQVRFGCPHVEADAQPRLIPDVDIAVFDNRIR
jgi:hypothetical protein